MTSVFDIFKPGVGPSSSHTMGPMTAGLRFVRNLAASGLLESVTRIEVELMGSLAATGIGHRTDAAVQLGLAGFDPATVDPDTVAAVLARVAADRRIALDGRHLTPFEPALNIVWSPRVRHERHANAVRFTAFKRPQSVLDQRLYFSVGGGSVLDEAEMRALSPHPRRHTPAGAPLCKRRRASGAGRGRRSYDRGADARK